MCPIVCSTRGAVAVIRVVIFAFAEFTGPSGVPRAPIPPAVEHKTIYSAQVLCFWRKRIAYFSFLSD